MIHDPQHTLLAAEPVADMRLALRFADGFEATVNLKDWSRRKPLQALANPALFRRARLDARGGYVVIVPDELELAADNLRNLAVEQAGGIGFERLWNWLARNELTQERAAASIGISRRMLSYYLSGTRPIPLTVWLACIGWEAQRDKAA